MSIVARSGQRWRRAIRDTIRAPMRTIDVIDPSGSERRGSLPRGGRAAERCNMHASFNIRKVDQ
jgi:hypothetical protein